MRHAKRYRHAMAGILTLASVSYDLATDNRARYRPFGDHSWARVAQRMRFEGFNLAGTHYGCKSRVLDFTFRIQRDLRIDVILYVKGNSKNMVKIIKAEFDIFAFEKPGGQRVDYKAQRTRTRSTTFKTKYQA